MRCDATSEAPGIRARKRGTGNRKAALTGTAMPDTFPPSMFAKRAGLFVLPLQASLLASIASIAGCYLSHGRDDAGTVVVSDAPTTDVPRDVPTPRDVRPDIPFISPDAGSACSRDAECPGALCVLNLAVAPEDRVPVPLVCGGAGMLAPGTECEENAACENGLCALAGGCVEPCLDDGDCRMGERCAEVPIVTDRRAIQPASACVRWVDAPPSVRVTDDTTISVSPFSSRLYDVPASSSSHRLILHVGDRYDASRTVDRIALSGPGGATLYDIGSAGLTPQINPGVAFFDLASILLPNAPWPPGLRAGGAVAYAITAGGESTQHRVVLEHEGDGRTLDLNLYLVGIAPTARTRRIIADMLDGYGDILATYDVALGRTRQFEVVGSLAATFGILEDEQEVGELFLLSAGAARPAVNVFLVQSSPVFLGIAGGIPGAMDMHGTRSSGIALGFSDLEAALSSGFPSAFLSVVLAHEIGHFSGLFHTSESDGSAALEPLPDTGVCDLSRDENGDGLLTADECVGFGGDNIMFWAVIEPDSIFTANQRDVVSSAPVLLP